MVVVDFTNNAQAIMKAFTKYRKGPPFEPQEPDKETCVKLLHQILEANVFSKSDAKEYGRTARGRE